MQRGAVRASHTLRLVAVRPSARPLSSSPSMPASASRSTPSRGATASRTLNGGAVRSVMRLYAPLTPGRSVRRYATEQAQATKAPETPQPPPTAKAAASPKASATGTAAPGGKGKARKLDIGEMLKGVEVVKLEPYMERMKAMPPDEAAGLVLMNGWTNYNHGHTAEAIKFFEAARRLNLEADTPDSRKDALECWNALVVAHATKGRLGVAVDELLGKLEHQLKAKEIEVESFFKDVQDLIKLYNEMELHEEALALLDTVVEHVLPKVGDREAGLWTYGELANQLRQLESYDEALEVAHGVLESEATIYPKEPHKSFNTHIFIATVHQDRGDRQATVEALSKALDSLRSMSKGETFWKYTAFIYENLADHSEELGLLDKAIKYKELQLSALSEVVEFVLTTGASPWLVAEQDLRRLRDIQAGKKPEAEKL